MQKKALWHSPVATTQKYLETFPPYMLAQGRKLSHHKPQREYQTDQIHATASASHL